MYDMLSGLQVVEAATFIAAPSCALQQLQMGAEVIRIAQAGGSRWSPPRSEADRLGKISLVKWSSRWTR